MCGIFAYSGPQTDAPKLVVEGLKCLEYRGYDSWGLAYKSGQNIELQKDTGKIGDLDISKQKFPSSGLAIGHTRWATHGGVVTQNAHPHFSQNKKIVLVHNGVMENYLEKKAELKKAGYEFQSETDTEVFANLIEKNFQGDFAKAVQTAIHEAEGRYAIAAINSQNNELIAARKGSPLIIGVGKNKGEYFIASDIPAFSKYTNRIMYLDDNQLVKISNDKIEFFDLNTGKEIEKREIEITLDKETAEKGEFSHFMIKEIMEQKETLDRAINQDPSVIESLAKAIKTAFGTYFIGCGTAGKVAMLGEYLFAKIARKHINFTFGSEFSNHREFLTDKTLLVAISQSGETADTLEAIEIAKSKGVKVAAIVNVESSTMARNADILIPIKAGIEKAVASTKATTAQIAILTLLAYACDGGINIGKQLLIRTASEINDMLNPRYAEHIHKIAEKIRDVESMYIIGRGLNYPIALEAAIKLQEVSYIHAEGFAGGELKHGPLALIGKNTPVIVLVANDENRQDILTNAIEVKARGGYIIGISPERHEVFDFWIRVPDTGHTSPIVNIIPVQILAYQLAVLRENDPDKPRNLAKSVTVK